MKPLIFKKIDAFTGGGSSGNPAGYVRLNKPDELTEAEMQQVAAELKSFVSEVGFLSEEGGVYQLRYYSSECEVAFCGHATIAILYDLLQADPRSEVTIRVKAGDLTVYNRLTQEDAVYITAPVPKFIDKRLSAGDAACALGLNVDAISTGSPIRLIDAGLRTLLVPITRLDDVLSMQPDHEKLRQFSLDHDFDITLVFCEETARATTRFRTRVFPPKFGYLEDPATGSGNSAFGYYLLTEGRWPGDLSLEQGPSREKPNIVKLKLQNMDGQDRILFGGGATTRISGEYQLHSF